MDQLVLDQHTLALLEQALYNQEKNQLSKREQVALSILQGMVTKGNVGSDQVKQAYEIADCFLRESQKSE